MLLDDSIGPGSSSNIAPFFDSKKAKTMNKFKTNTAVVMKKNSDNSKSGQNLNRNTDADGDGENYRAMLNDKAST